MATKAKSLRTLNAELVESKVIQDYWFEQYLNTETRLSDAIVRIATQLETITKQNDIIDDFIEENLNLHHELILQRDCNRMAHEVVQLANELNKPSGKIDVPAGVSPQDALKFHQAAINAKIDAGDAILRFANESKWNWSAPIISSL